MGVDRISAAFSASKARGEVALMPYVPVGYPRPGATEEIVPALVDGGAAIVELGVPFSDPLLDGPTIQRATQVALEQGVNFDRCLEAAAAIRRQVEAPLLFMGAYNPLHRRGLARAAEESAAAGVDGLIVPDLPPEEAGELLAAARANDLALVFLAAPTSSEARLRRVAESASGFIYCISLTGVTGARRDINAELGAFLSRVRQYTDLPLAVGFGVSTAQHVAQIGAIAEGVAIGSAVVDRISQNPGHEAEAVREYMLALRGQPVGQEQVAAGR